MSLSKWDRLCNWGDEKESIHLLDIAIGVSVGIMFTLVILIINGNLKIE